MTAKDQHPGSVPYDKAAVGAIGYRPAVIPVVAFIGAAINNAGAILTELAPWAYLGFVVLLVAFAGTMQRRQRRVWPWSIAIGVGFVIALVGWLATMAIVNVIAPTEVSRL